MRASDREIETELETERQTERQRGRERNRERERGRERERERERERKRDKKKERQCHRKEEFQQIDKFNSALCFNLDKTVGCRGTISPKLLLMNRAMKCNHCYRQYKESSWQKNYLFRLFDLHLHENFELEEKNLKLFNRFITTVKELKLFCQSVQLTILQLLMIFFTWSLCLLELTVWMWILQVELSCKVCSDRVKLYEFWETTSFVIWRTIFVFLEYFHARVFDTF